MEGIEPSYSAWKAAALPLSYTRAGDQLTRCRIRLNLPGTAFRVAGDAALSIGIPGARLDRGLFRA